MYEGKIRKKGSAKQVIIQFALEGNVSGVKMDSLEPQKESRGFWSGRHHYNASRPSLHLPPSLILNWKPRKSSSIFFFYFCRRTVFIWRSVRLTVVTSSRFVFPFQSYRDCRKVLPSYQLASFRHPRYFLIRSFRTYLVFMSFSRFISTMQSGWDQKKQRSRFEEIESYCRSVGERGLLTSRRNETEVRKLSVFPCSLKKVKGKKKLWLIDNG